MKLRCYLLSLLRIHHNPNCKYCVARTSYGTEMRKRLKELGWRTKASSPELVGAFESEPGEVITLPVSLKARKSV